MMKSTISSWSKYRCDSARREAISIVSTVRWKPTGKSPCTTQQAARMSNQRGTWALRQGVHCAPYFALRCALRCALPCALRCALRCASSLGRVGGYHRDASVGSPLLLALTLRGPHLPTHAILDASDELSVGAPWASPEAALPKGPIRQVSTPGKHLEHPVLIGHLPRRDPCEAQVTAWSQRASLLGVHALNKD